MANLKIKKGDTVVVISGDDKGKKGKVIATSPKERKVIVEGINIVKKHVKPRRQGENGGIIDVEGALYADKVALFCDKCGKATRVSYKVEDDKKIRVCAKCGENL